jgi:hypothetical protein
VKNIKYEWVSDRVSRVGMGLWVDRSDRFIFLSFKLILSGGSGIHPTKNLKSVIRPLSEYFKYPYPYPSVYMLTDGRTDDRFGRIGRAGQVSRFFAHPYLKSIGLLLK